LEDNDPRNVVHYFKGERQAILLMCMLARTADTGGKRCFRVAPVTNANSETHFAICFLPEKWQEVMNPNKDERSRLPPTVKEMQWFVRGYLRALTGVKPTVF
jgi:hypothetical protein